MPYQEFLTSQQYLGTLQDSPNT